MKTVYENATPRVKKVYFLLDGKKCTKNVAEKSVLKLPQNCEFKLLKTEDFEPKK